MTLESQPAPVRDPFMRAVRRRHADVDLVLLPPGPPGAGSPGENRPGAHPAEPVQPTDPAVARAAGEVLVADVAATADLLWAVAGPLARLGAREDALVPGAATGAVEARSRLLAETDDGDAVLTRVVAALHDAGWEAERAAGAVERLSASGDGQSLRVTHARAGGRLMLEVVSGPLDVGPRAARVLLEPGR